MLVKDAKAIVNISNGNSKMPGTTFAQDSFACNVGSRLAEVKGSICEGCYARRIQKMRPSVDQGWKRNYELAVKLISHNPDKWVAACVFQIKRQALKKNEPYHRWFDSGDIDSIEQLIAIADVAKETPEINHWLPTREIAIVQEYLAWFGSFPENLVVRVSSPMVDQAPVNGFRNTSTVHRSKSEPHGQACPAPTQGNACGDCRACWNPNVGNVSYKKH
jgi:hypothetical protein